MTDAPSRRRGRAAALCAALLAAACSPLGPGTDVARDGRYALPIGGAPVVGNPTAHSAELDCLARALPAGARPRVAVGRIADYTGKFDLDGGRRVTQGAALMAISALDRLGLPLVERLDTSVAMEELKLANNNLIADAGGVRQIRPGSVAGSDLVLMGGITELNYNIGSRAGDLFSGGLGLGARLYVMNIAIDLRLVETTSMRVVEVASLQKQILGREIRAGVFEFFDGTLFDLSVSDRALEPVQLAVRTTIERGVGDMARSLFGLDPGTCAPSPEPAADAAGQPETEPEADAAGPT